MPICIYQFTNWMYTTLQYPKIKVLCLCLPTNQSTYIILMCATNPDHNSTQKGLEINRRNKIYSHVICFTFQNTTTALIMPTHSFVTDFTSHTRNVNTNRVHKSRWLCQFPEWNVRWVNQVNIYIGRIVTSNCVRRLMHVCVSVLFA